MEAVGSADVSRQSSIRCHLVLMNRTRMHLVEFAEVSEVHGFEDLVRHDTRSRLVL